MADAKIAVPPDNDHIVRNETDRFKCIYDYFKHLTTVLTAVILLVPNLLHKSDSSVQGSTHSELFGIGGIIFLSITIFACIAAYSLTIRGFPTHTNMEMKNKGLFGFSLGIIWFTFTAGIICISIFSALKIR